MTSPCPSARTTGFPVLTPLFADEAEARAREARRAGRLFALLALAILGAAIVAAVTL